MCQAFRKRQNLKLREAKDEVLGLFRRVLTQSCQTSIELRNIFREVSEELCGLGLSLGGSEDWADRLYIEDKKGTLLFSEEELDLAEEAQKRMEVMYNIDAWTMQLASRIRSADLLIDNGQTMSHDEVVQKALRRLEEDMHYHAELMDDSTSRLIRERIASLQLPCEINALAEELVAKLAAVFSLVVQELSTISASVGQIKLKAMRGAAAVKVGLDGAIQALHLPACTQDACGMPVTCMVAARSPLCPAYFLLLRRYRARSPRLGLCSAPYKREV